MALRKGFRQLVDEAKSRITTIGLEQARARHGRADVVFVDLRDVRELEREGARSPASSRAVLTERSSSVVPADDLEQRET
jgi:hypothetical protein